MKAIIILNSKSYRGGRSINLTIHILYYKAVKVNLKKSLQINILEIPRKGSLFSVRGD